MKALLDKQFRLVCHPMTLVFCLFGAMLLIPSYPYTVAFFYVMLGLFFSFMQGREQRDADFSALLPIRKRDTVRASAAFCTVIELLSLVIAVPFAMLGARVNPQGGNPVGLDDNAALFAAALLLYGVFNLVFMTAFYRSGSKAGTAFLKAMIPTALLMLVCEALPHLPGLMWLNDTSGEGNLRQLPLLVVCGVLSGVLTLAAYRRGAALYEKVDL